MALVVIGLGSVALVRSVSTGSLILGNLSFRQDALAATGAGAEQAITWLQNNINNSALNNHVTASGYYASSLDQLDPTGGKTSVTNKKVLVNWDGNCQGAAADTYSSCDIVPFTGTDVNGSRVQWVITRLCDTVGAASATNLCLRPATASISTASERGELQAGGRISGSTSSPYYRIIVRVQGARNTVSYTESLVHF